MADKKPDKTVQEAKKTDKEEKSGKDKEKKADDKDKDSKKPEAPAAAPQVFPLTEVIVHPLVLLNATDHFTRTTAGDLNKRVVGILLGEEFRGKLDILNSYAVPFEEDGNVWFLDHNYHEEMYAMFKKVNAREKVVGWYSTGPKIKPTDLEINEKIRRYTPNPVLVIIDVNPSDENEIPTTAYIAVENAPEEKSQSRTTFQHLQCEIGALEAEEVGVEHLLRNIRDTTVGTVTDRVTAKLTSLKGLKKRMEEMYAYLDDVVKGNLPPNPKIIYNMQTLLNLCADLKVKELVESFSIKSNDSMLAIYAGSLVRSVVALHNLINNKLENRDLEAKLAADKATAETKEAEKEKADKEKAEKAEKDKQEKQAKMDESSDAAAKKAAADANSKKTS